MFLNNFDRVRIYLLQSVLFICRLAVVQRILLWEYEQNLQGKEPLGLLKSNDSNFSFCKALLTLHGPRIRDFVLGLLERIVGDRKHCEATLAYITSSHQRNELQKLIHEKTPSIWGSDKEFSVRNIKKLCSGHDGWWREEMGAALRGSYCEIYNGEGKLLLQMQFKVLEV